MNFSTPLWRSELSSASSVTLVQEVRMRIGPFQ